MLSAAQNDENFLNKNIDWEFPIPIAYGPGRLNEISDFCNKFKISEKRTNCSRRTITAPIMACKVCIYRYPKEQSHLLLFDRWEGDEPVLS